MSTREYELDTKTKQYARYRPDFYFPRYGIYIEYYGIDRMGNVHSFFKSKNGKTATQVYRESIQWKRETHKSNNTKLIELYAYDREEGLLIYNLRKQLIGMGVELPVDDSQSIMETKEIEEVIELSPL